MVPKADSDTELASLKSGEVDFIFPQAYTGITTRWTTRTSSSTPGYGSDYEALYFQQARAGPFADRRLPRGVLAVDRPRRACTTRSTPRSSPGRPAAQLRPVGPDDRHVLRPDDLRRHLRPGGRREDPDRRRLGEERRRPVGRRTATSRRSAGWSTPATPVVRAPRRYLIPMLPDAGFNVVADNCDAACVFQQRLPALDYDLAMYINTAAAGPDVPDSVVRLRPDPDRGERQQGSEHQRLVQRGGLRRCCTRPTRARRGQARAELDQDGHQASWTTDHVMLPLFQFPNVGAGAPTRSAARSTATRQLPGVPELLRVERHRR